MRVLSPSVKEVFFEMMWGHMPILEFEKWAKSSYDLLNEFYSLYSVDYDFLKELAVDLRDRMIKDPTASLQPELGIVTQKIIDWLTGGKIVLTGVYDEYLCSYSYNDLRTENDKNPVLRDPL